MKIQNKSKAGRGKAHLQPIKPASSLPPDKFKKAILEDLSYIIDAVDSLLTDLKVLQASLEEWL